MPRKLLDAAVTGLRNSPVRLRNHLARLLPGKRPAWLVLNLTGSFPVRKAKRKLLSIQSLTGQAREFSQEELEALISSLLTAEWLEGVVIRLDELQLDWASSYALRNQLQRLKQGGKKLTVTSSLFTNTSYYLASIADELIVPESAEFHVNGSAFAKTYMADFLDRFGIRFRKLAIREYKSAMDDMVRSSMSEGDREQLTVLLESLQRSFATDVAEARRQTPGEVRDWVQRSVSSAAEAQRIGMVDRVAYEDEFVTSVYRKLGSAQRFLTRPLRASPAGQVAFVSLQGNIVPGKSRQFPVPVPLFGDLMAGSETLVQALRTAAKDPNTAAVVFHVDSGGGSPLASDLIWREIKLLAERMPVVAVMGSVAASGGYYVLTHATRIVAAPATLTGSIGVVTGKPVLEEFNRSYGFNPEIVKNGRFADLYSSGRDWDGEEEALVSRYMDEVYDRFTSRVAAGRNLSVERVNEIGRGRIWSGEDAIGVGLVDELGDVASAISLAKELAGLSRSARVRNVEAPHSYVLPVGPGAGEVQRAVAPLLKERALLLAPFTLRAD